MPHRWFIITLVAAAITSGAVQSAGSWGQAIEVPGLGALNTAGVADLPSVSCTSAGNCAAAGFAPGHGFVVSEKHGVWAKAVDVPGLGALSNGRYADFISVSCVPNGSCAAGGDYEDMPVGSQGYVITEKKGVWGKAAKVPGLQALNKAGGAAVESISCPRAGSCTAAGTFGRGYRRGYGSLTQVFVTVNGR